ncbi:hypothetical protein DdX_19798 [Ditylenchus destructor]|uniref:Uncharacterized protein n=1 Tax=Ditylenchus destructor TaxID=166010 RepID=A0AAD4MIA1_9BILA|nr:hypothetical protein DdX_19798 [Ditylenchus destructor]
MSYHTPTSDDGKMPNILHSFLDIDACSSIDGRHFLRSVSYDEDSREVNLLHHRMNRAKCPEGCDQCCDSDGMQGPDCYCDKEGKNCKCTRKVKNYWNVGGK